MDAAWAKQALENATPFDMTSLGPVVYVLYCKEKPMYIGQSMSLYHRLLSHRSKRRIAFDSVRYIPVDARSLDDLEESLIALLTPPGNKMTLCRATRRKQTDRVAIDGRIGAKIVMAREAAGLSQEKLAARAGVTTNTIHRIETDCVAPKIATVEKLARALGVEPGTLFA